MGGMAPSKATLDRLPKALSERWEAKRVAFGAQMRETETVPDEAVSVGVSLDGVLVPMKDGGKEAKRARTTAAGRLAKGPAGYSEASVGTLTLYDREGTPLRTVRLGRMPEPNKLTLKSEIEADFLHIIEQRPDLKVVAVADGVADNWTFLDQVACGRRDEQVLDFYHAAEHLHAALVAAYGEGTEKCSAEFAAYRHILRHDRGGADKVIRHLRYLASRFRRKPKIATEVRYFRKRRKRMDYARLAARGLPIGSGIVEAACKTLVSQRFKRSGMRWRHPGGQAILTLRALTQSDRFDAAWALLKATYVRRVHYPENLIRFPRARASA